MCNHCTKRQVQSEILIYEHRALLLESPGFSFLLPASLLLFPSFFPKQFPSTFLSYMYLASYIEENTDYVAFWLWLLLFNTISSPIHFPENGTISSFFVSGHSSVVYDDDNFDRWLPRAGLSWWGWEMSQPSPEVQSHPLCHRETEKATVCYAPVRSPSQSKQRPEEGFLSPL